MRRLRSPLAALVLGLSFFAGKLAGADWPNRTYPWDHISTFQETWTRVP